MGADAYGWRADVNEPDADSGYRDIVLSDSSFYTEFSSMTTYQNKDEILLWTAMIEPYCIVDDTLFSI
jgi:hypothetical protein